MDLQLRSIADAHLNFPNYLKVCIFKNTDNWMKVIWGYWNIFKYLPTFQSWFMTYSIIYNNEYHLINYIVYIFRISANTLPTQNIFKNSLNSQALFFVAGVWVLRGIRPQKNWACGRPYDCFICVAANQYTARWKCYFEYILLQFFYTTQRFSFSFSILSLMSAHISYHTQILLAMVVVLWRLNVTTS